MDITERKILEDQLKRQARIDYLTGLSNRGYFMELAVEEFNRSARYGNSLTLLMMDIDFFKKINDMYGHQAGDTVLIKLAETCLSMFREVDSIGRLMKLKEQEGIRFVLILKISWLWCHFSASTSRKRIIKNLCRNTRANAKLYLWLLCAYTR